LLYDSQRIPWIEVAAYQQSVVTIQLTFLGYENVSSADDATRYSYLKRLI
jgi:hypothetical protein